MKWKTVIKDWNKNWPKMWDRKKNTHRNIDEELKQTNIHNKANCDALNMDLTDIREKIAIEKKSNRKWVMNSE